MTGILIAFAVVAAVGLFVGVLLALASHFFGVEEDVRVKDLRGMLPGINCGACGFKGCDDYAAALAAGITTPDKCVPGAADVAGELADYLGVEAKALQGEVAFVHCNRCHAPTASANTYEGVMTCKAASMLYGGPEACTYACLGLGDCAAVCPANAICLRDGIAHIDTVRCLGCGLCVTVCPKHVIGMVPQDARTVVMCSSHDKGAVARKKCTNACIACKKCEKTCPNGAILVVNNLATVDYEKCDGCGLCNDVCPTGGLRSLILPNE